MMKTRPLQSNLISNLQRDWPTVRNFISIMWNAFVGPFRDPRGILLGSAIVAMMLWGYHGKLELIGMVWDGWTGPGSDPTQRARIIPGIPWDQEWLSFWLGALLLVGIPSIIIRHVFKMRLRDFGLGLPPRGLRRLALIGAVGLFVFSFATFYQYGNLPSMVSTYPFYRHPFDSASQFVIYELGYLPFFLAIEFIFRGYLLFGMVLLPARNVPVDVASETRIAHADWRILIPMLAYTAWHFGKPIPELWGTLFWGLASSAIVLATRSIWPIVIVHWLLNVWMDLVIWQRW